MIVFVTTHKHSYTVRPLVRGEFDVEIPVVQSISYDALFQAEQLPAATYVFTDLDRLDDDERALAADVHCGLGEAGLARLNDPARVLLRYDLLKALHRAGINPFDVYRADEQPRPKRFPVILRREDEHKKSPPPLVGTQDSLDEAIAAARDAGAPLKRMIVIEFCAEAIAPGIFRRFGTSRAGDGFRLTQSVTEDSWYVKEGNPWVANEAMQIEVIEAMRDNRFSDDIRPAFEIAHIEYGRADHATVGGRQVIYEINTNPMIRARREKPVPALILERDAIARQQTAQLLWGINSGDGRAVRFPRSERLEDFRRRHLGFARLFSWFRRRSAPPS